MKKLILLILLIPSLLFAGPLQQAHKKVIAGQTVAGGGDSYEVDEGYEGSGAPSGYTTTSGTPEYDYTTEPIFGSESLFLNAQYERTTYTFSHTGEININFVVVPTGESSYQFASCSGTTAVDFLFMSAAGQLRIDHEGAYRGISSALGWDSPVYIWLRRVPSSGSNDGILQVWVSTTDSKPETPLINRSDGTGTDEWDTFAFMCTGSVNTTKFDRFRILE